MQKKYLAFMFLLFFPIFSFASHVNTTCNKQDTFAIHAAITSYIEKNSDMHAQDVTILKLQCLNRYASAIVHPKKPVTDDATVYLQKTKKWKVLALGTDFDRHQLKEIPKQIRTF